MAQKVIAALQLLAEQGLGLPFPYRSHVRGDLHELRAKFGNLRGRLLFTCHMNAVVLLHGFVKGTAKVAEKEIALAEERWKRYKARG